MSGRTLRWLGLGLLSTAGAGVMVLTGMMNSAFAYGDVPPDPAETIGLVMGGSGQPIPGSDVVEAADTLYIHPNFPATTYPPPYANGLSTPEGLYPLIGVHSLYLNYPLATTGPLAGFPAESSSVGQGMLILENAIASNMAAGDASTVFGASQSATISSLVMQQLESEGQTFPSGSLQFVLIGDPSAPNGGLLERFDFPGAQLNLPSLGVSFDGATPSDYVPTDIYTLEYDGFADFPKYPINFLADLNAFLGIEEIHDTYGAVPPEEIANAILLPGSMASGTTDSLTNYYMIPETPPLVSLLPKPLADLLGPDLTYLINLGYNGAGDVGWSTPANVATPFGLFPNVSLQTVFDTLVTDTEKGISAFVADLSNPSAMASALADPVAVSSAVAAAPAALPSLTEIVNGISSAASSLYSALLPTADIVNALVTTLPAYDVTLFLDNLTNPLDAIGLPIAADTALVTLAAGFEFSVVDSAITGAISAITALIP
jgi:PE-PPE domain